MDIDSVIDNAELHDIRSVTGDCATVASALIEVFGGEFVCLYSSENGASDTLPAHVLVEIDGRLYDGLGETTRQEAFEIHLVMNGFATKDEDIEKYFVAESPPEYMIDEAKEERVIKALEEHTS